MKTMDRSGPRPVCAHPMNGSVSSEEIVSESLVSRYSYNHVTRAIHKHVVGLTLDVAWVGGYIVRSVI